VPQKHTFRLGTQKANAHSNAARLSANEPISARIKELLTAVAERAAEAAARKRSWRVAVLQDLIDDSLALIAARKVMYADAKGEGRTLEVVDAAGEKAAIANGFSQRTAAISETYPKTMDHLGYPNGAATGMMVKDYRGKDANQEIWKYDGGLAGTMPQVQSPDTCEGKGAGDLECTWRRIASCWNRKPTCRSAARRARTTATILALTFAQPVEPTEVEEEDEEAEFGRYSGSGSSGSMR
jgi:hypothetical protein